MLQKLKDPQLLRTQAFVDGNWIPAESGRLFPVINPATGETVASVADLGAPETLAAIAAADRALPAWRSQTAKSRAQLLRRWYDLIIENQDDLALIMTIEQGKPLAEARGEVLYGASYVEWFAEEARRIYGDVIPTHAADKRLLTIKQPVGVTAAITPWNFPLAMIARKVAPALAAGCTMVIKPSEETPLSALALAALAERAGIPAGVVNVVVGTDANAIGHALTDSPIVRKLSFTGSTRVGKVLLDQCAATVKRTSMELGGNAPFIVFDDADLDAAVEGALASKYRNTGQTCVCANRFLVQAGVYDAFADKLAAKVREFRLGDGTQPGINMGPLINRTAVDKVEHLVQDALSKGATALTGGTRAAQGERFYTPTVLTGITKEMEILRDEIFGPVAPLLRFETEAEAIALANDTPYGLAAYFYSGDLNRIWRVAEQLEYGMVGINEGIFSTEIAPFGGVKESGSGREGSKYGIDEYVEIKYLCMGIK